MTQTRRLLCALVTTVLLGSLVALGPVSSPPASAEASRYLCTGYVGCKQDGYPHFGYRKAGQQMWWRMYAGHNCTNYVAYRLVRGGMSEERPWSGTGMAWNWGKANRSLTDKVPMVGSVAWWKRNAPGAGSSGHVAYVERVISRRKIVVSEDSWSGDFHWRRIVKGQGGWPTGFVHFDDRRVENRARPTVAGTPEVGHTLTAGSGRWAPAASYRYQWVVDGQPRAGATGPTFELTPTLRGSRVAVRVFARERGHLEGRATSERTPRIAKGTMAVTSRPAVSGIPRVGEPLRLEPGSWSPAPASTSIRWFADGRRIDGARGPRLLVDRRWVGQRITVRTTARTEGYKASPTTSEPTGKVQKGRFEVTSPFTLGGRGTHGARLSVAPGEYHPAEGEVHHTWLRNGRELGRADGRHLDLGPGEVGKRIAVRVTLRHPGYQDRVMLLELPQRVTTTPDVRATTKGRPGRAVVKVRVSAPGVPVPGGPVTVRVGGREVSGKLREGRLRAVVRGLDRGTHRVRVAYAGTKVVLPGTAATTVKVPRRRGQ